MIFLHFPQIFVTMPRIDPQQLLKTLEVLLSPKGGIKSDNEVVRLVQLMQKFSKKLVSKSIYIEILRATTPELLEKFLQEKGWDLLNLWFADSVKTQNWPLCIDLMSLFAVCPITASLLKDTAEVNHAPKLINQLRVNPAIGDDVRTQANQVSILLLSISAETF
jgi:protein phosphatase 1 regulatory subunit 10